MAEVKRREIVTVVASTKAIKGIMSLTISMTMRRRTRVLLKREKIWNGSTLWKKLRKVRRMGLTQFSVEDYSLAAIATSK